MGTLPNQPSIAKYSRQPHKRTATHRRGGTQIRDTMHKVDARANISTHGTMEDGHSTRSTQIQEGENVRRDTRRNRDERHTETQLFPELTIHMSPYEEDNHFYEENGYPMPHSSFPPPTDPYYYFHNWERGEGPRLLLRI